MAAEKMMSEMILEEQRARIAREMQDQVMYHVTCKLEHLAPQFRRQCQCGIVLFSNLIALSESSAGVTGI